MYMNLFKLSDKAFYVITCDGTSGVYVGLNKAMACAEKARYSSVYRAYMYKGDYHAAMSLPLYRKEKEVSKYSFENLLV